MKTENNNAGIVNKKIAGAFEGELIFLDLSGLGISELPSEIGQLNSLEWLDLNNNELSELPAEITQLSNLRISNNG